MSLDNPMGSSQAEIVAKMQSNRAASKAEEPTGPTDEAETAETETETTEEAAAGVDDQSEADQADQDRDASDSEAEGSTEDGGTETQDENYSEPIDTISYDYDSDSDTYSFKSNGKTVRANADKLIERFSQAENYTKDKMALSDERKQSQEQIAQKVAELSAERSKISDLSAELEALVKVEESSDLSELEEYDPSEYIRVTKERETRKTALNKVRGELKQASDEQFKDKVNRESQALLRALPHWSDQEVMQKEMKTLSSYLATKGLTADDVAGITDHRIYLMAVDAAKYQEMQARSSKVKKQIKKAPKSVKPGLKGATRDEQQFKQVKENLKRSGKIDDAVALLKAKRANR